ncbi:MAG: DUF58 domain-containing protein, partial [Oscillospiraceae bacterium]|nr:DUF58 domain-containing protein [Oscillospiraceae bacterium]
DQATMTEKFESVTQSDKISQEIDQVAQLRDYQPGDKVRLIHWAVSAHMEKPQIREFEDPNAAEIALIAPWPKPPEASELLQDRSSWKSSQRGGLSGLYRHPGILGPSWSDSFIRLSDAAGDIAAGILLQLARGSLPYRFIGPSSDRRSAALTDIRLEVNAPVDPALLALGEQLVDLPLEQAMDAARAANDNLPRLLLDTLPDNVRLCIVVLTELNDLLLEALTALAGSRREVAVVYVSSTESTSAELSTRLARLGIPLLTINCAEVLDRPAPAADLDPHSPERSRRYA